MRQGFFLCGISSGRRRGRAEDISDIYCGFPNFAGGDCTSKDYELAGFGVLVPLDLVKFTFCPFLIFSVSGVGKVGPSDEDFGRYVYRLAMKPGWCFCTTSSGGFITLLGVPSSGVRGLLVVLEVPDSLQSGDVMASSHLLWTGRPAGKLYGQ